MTDPERVSYDTRERVIKAARMLQFQPNRLARELRIGARSTAVGLVVADLTNPFYSAVAAAAERQLEPAGLDLFIGSTNEDPQREHTVVTSMLSRRIQALLIVPAATDQSYLLPEARLGTPLIFLDRPPGNLAADAVVGNDRAAARAAMTDLMAHHDHVVVIGDVDVAWTARERLAGVHDAMITAGSASDHIVITDVHDAAQAHEASRALLDRTVVPTAFFGLNNLITLGILQALRDRGHRATVMGFDDSDVMELLGVTAVALAPAKLGGRACARALERIADPDLPVELIELAADRIERTPLDQPIRVAGRAG